MFRLALLLLLAIAPAAAQGPPTTVTFPPGEVGSILGRPVLDAAGTEIGPIVDVLVGQDGHPRVAVIDVGGFLGIGTRRVAVAWDTLRFGRDGQGQSRITDDLTLDEVAAAPEFRAADGPVTAIGPRPR
jgi:hypothetical protein